MTPRPDQGTLVVVCLFLVLFLGVADNQMLSPLLPAIRDRLGRSSQELGYLFTAYSACAGVSVLLWGPLTDRFGCKRGLVLGLLVFALGSGITYQTRDFQTLMTGRLVTGMGASMLSLNAISYAAEYFPYQARGWAMGSIVSSYFAALILGVPVASWMGDEWGWNSAFGAVACAALVLLAATQILLPRPERRRPVEDAELLVVRQLRTYLSFFKSSRTVGALVSSFFASAGTMGFLAFLGIWLNESFSVPGNQIGLVFLASGVAALVASPFAGSLSDRLGKRPQFVLSNLALALFLFVLPGLRWGPWLFILFGAISLAAAFRQGPMEALLTEVVAPASRGSFIALKNSFSQLGIALAALTSGILFESAGYWAVCLLGSAANIAAAAGVIIWVREPL